MVTRNSMPGLTAPSMRKPSWLRFPQLSQPASPVFTTSGIARKHIADHGQAGVEAPLGAAGSTKQEARFGPPARLGGVGRVTAGQQACAVAMLRLHRALSPARGTGRFGMAEARYRAPPESQRIGA